MINALITSAALLASATVVNAIGRAVVVNNCDFEVSMTNVPAADGGQNQIGPQSLAKGGAYSQTWTPLSNDQGWSIKLYKGSDMGSLIQYEYTFHDDGTIWYDLSAVNGDPFNGDWSLSSSGGCDPRQAAYRYPTDDTYGMQSCSDSATITVTLCGAGGGSAPPPAGSAAAPSYQAPAPSYQAPAPSAPAGRPDRRPSPPESAAPAPQYPAPSVPAAVPSVPAVNSYAAEKAANVGPTTFATKLAVAPDTVVHYHTQVVTEYVTISPSPVKRSEEHLHRHAQHHHF